MKNLLLLAMVIGLLMLSVCYAEPVKIYGVTLGKPFNESGLRECRFESGSRDLEIKYYDWDDSNCYMNRRLQHFGYYSLLYPIN
jgi:hypothetical protein